MGKSALEDYKKSKDEYSKRADSWNSKDSINDYGARYAAKWSKINRKVADAFGKMSEKQSQRVNKLENDIKQVFSNDSISKINPSYISEGKDYVEYILGNK